MSGTAKAMRRISSNITYSQICPKALCVDESSPLQNDTNLCIVVTKEQVLLEGNMSGSPPRSGPWYHPAGHHDHPKWHDYHSNRSPPRGVSPPRGGSPAPHFPPRRSRSPPSPTNKERPPSRRSLSPRPVRPPSPKEYYSRPRSPHREPSPRRDRYPSSRRPPSPWDYRRSPPRQPYPPPPESWRRRSRSPPRWIRRTPPPYMHPRGRSPPRSWVPPPPEWDRFHLPARRPSPPRWGPPHPMEWDRRWGPPPNAIVPPERRKSPARDAPPAILPQGVAPPELARGESSNVKVEDGIYSPGDDKDDEIDTYDLPEYDPEIPLGQKYVIAVSGFFCKICHKFYNSEVSAKITHCKSKNHYDKFSKWLSEKQVAALLKKREAESTATATADDEKKDEPPSKQIKIEANLEDSYDPSEPTEEETVPAAKHTVVENIQVKIEPIMVKTEPQEDLPEQQPPEYNSDSDALITTEVKKEMDGFVEATLYNLRKMRVNQLKANLEKRGLKSTGLKTLLLKRLEKVLMEETAAANEQKQDDEAIGLENGDKPSEGNPYMLKLMESDIEVTNEKAQWITDEELIQQLTKIPGVKKVDTVKSNKMRLGRKTVIEWTINLSYTEELPKEGLCFDLSTHQKLPFKAILEEDSA